MFSSASTQKIFNPIGNACKRTVQFIVIKVDIMFEVSAEHVAIKFVITLLDDFHVLRAMRTVRPFKVCRQFACPAHSVLFSVIVKLVANDDAVF